MAWRKKRKKRRQTFCVEAIHHGLHHIQLVLNWKVDEVGIQKDVVRRAQRSIILEEQWRSNLLPVKATRKKDFFPHKFLNISQKVLPQMDQEGPSFTTENFTLTLGSLPSLSLLLSFSQPSPGWPYCGTKKENIWINIKKWKWKMKNYEGRTDILGSFGLIIRLTSANLRVFLAFPCSARPQEEKKKKEKERKKKWKKWKKKKWKKKKWKKKKWKD